MQKYGEWDVVKPLGKGGQSEVYLARNPARAAERSRCLKEIRAALDEDKRAELATAIYTFARPDLPSELGAIKQFKIREGGAGAAERLKREISVLQQRRPNLPKLLEANEEEQWMVTEYFPAGTLADSPGKFKGEAVSALRAFRTLVETVATSLHNDNIVHRDIKPANVFIGNEGSLIPGDFGIVYLPNQDARPTVTGERVGSWEYMPQWADLGVRHENVQPNFDVYMLGKLLWCMIAGRTRLPREYHRWGEFNLAAIFPDDKRMHIINSILDKCLVERPERCLASATELLKVVDEGLTSIDQDLPQRDEKGDLILPCHICGKGFYRPTSVPTVSLHPASNQGATPHPILARPFVCNVCTNYQFFAPGYPEEAAGRGWRRWTN